MKSVIAGTAGHIDHGKTALVKALTGIDADRLEEEKRRGITIDIGFAHMELRGPGGEPIRIGFIDVPGHERFVRNMLAGVGGIDFVLLVISAEESIKPQTREHFDICRLLEIPRGLTALTKADLVDRDTLSVVRMEIEEFLRGSFLEGAPIIPVSSKTGEGLVELKQALAELAADSPARNSLAPFRLPIDRVFTMKGFGTVVTGTLLSGSVKKEQELEVFPSGQLVRVRGVQVHGREAEEASAGQRTALNVSGASTEELSRGMTLAPSGMFRPTRQSDVSLTLLSSARALKDHARVHLHVYTAETIAQIALYESISAEGTTRRPLELTPGATAYAQLRLAEPLLLFPGDHFILRQFSPVVTIGGGVVVDAAPLPKKKRDTGWLPSLENLAQGTPEQVLATRVARRGKNGLALTDAVAETGWLRSRVEEVAANQKTLRLGEILLSKDAFEATQTEAMEAMNAFHNTNPLVAGIGKEELRARLQLGPEVFAAVLETLVRGQKLAVAGEQIHAPGRGVELTIEEADSKRTIEQAFATAGLKVPALKEVLAGLKVDSTRARKLMTLLLRDRVLVKVSEELVFHRDALEQLRRAMQEQKVLSPRIDVARFKDLTGVSRKYAIPLLEWLDRERVTKRVGDERVIL